MSKSTQEAQIIYENGFQTSFIMSELISVVLYMRDVLNYKPLKRKEELIKFVEKYKHQCNGLIKHQHIMKALNKAKNKKMILVDYNDVTMNEKEMSFFNNLDIDYESKKILFTFYVYYKRSVDYNNKYRNPKMGFTISADAPVLQKMKKQTKLNQKVNFLSKIHFLKDNEYVSFYGETNLYLLFIKNMYEENSDIFDNENIVLTIKDLNSIGWYFDKVNNKSNYTECKNCNKMFRNNLKNNKKYCIDCAKENEKERARIDMQKNRNNKSKNVTKVKPSKMI